MEFNRNLTPYQMVHLLKLKSNGLNGLLISDGVGVGKTIAAGYIIEFATRVMKQNCIVCCPPVLEQKWIEELRIRFGIEAYSVKQKEDFNIMIEEMNTKKESTMPRTYVLPYSTAINRDFSHVQSLGCVIFDEVHHARNNETQLYQSLKSISSHSAYRVGLSATPIHNSIEDLSSIMSLLFPVLDLGSWNLIIKEIWARNKIEVLHPFITKFDKSELGIHFTKRNVHNVEVEHSASFTNSVQLTIDKKGERRGKPLSAFEKNIFFRLASSSPAAFFNSQKRDLPKDYDDPKIKALVQLINEKKGERWIIFTEFRATAELIAKNLSNFDPAIVSGESSISERYIAIDDFRKNSQGILIMMPVGCEGLDLQVCSRLVNYDLHWNPMVIEQRIGRIDRIGQNKKEIEIFNFLVRGSIDHHMISVMKDKIGLVTNTFANIEPMLNSDKNQALEFDMLADDFYDSNGIGIMGRLSTSLPNTDYLLQSLLNEDICKIELWPTTITQWDDTLNLLNDPKAVAQVNKIRQGSMFLIEIISDYL
jgi:SNF2 family DNA or RNA helicase